MRIDPAIKRAKIAMLLEHFHVRIEDLARLTDKQIDELYFHPRNDKGAIEPQEKPTEAADGKPTLKSELMALWKMAKALRMPPEQWMELEKQLRAKYAEMGETWAGQMPIPNPGGVILGEPI